MIVLSVGMPRAGSGWHYNLIHDLMATSGCSDAREIRQQFHLERILTEVNCNIGVLSLRRLAMVTVPSLIGKTFVIKAHAGPTVWSWLLSHNGVMRIAYIYRDPRDAMLSAFDYGQRAIAKGRPNAFSHLTDFEKAVDFIKDYLEIWDAWMGQDNVLKARYEDLLTDYDAEVARLIDFLKLNDNRPAVQKVVEQYRPGKAESGRQGLHYFKGKIGRFREVYSPEQQLEMVAQFGPYLRRMGYES
jgi:hypothetical protein